MNASPASVSADSPSDGARQAGLNASLSRVGRGSAANLVGAVTSAISSFALAVVITRGMTKVDAGVFFSVTSLVLVATSIGQLGTDSGLVYFLSRARALGNRSRIHDYVRSAIGPVLVAGLAMSVAIFVFAPQLGEVTNPHHAHAATGYLRTLSLFIAPACLGTVILSATRGLGTMRANVVVEQVGRQSVQVLLVAFAVAMPAHTWVAWAWSIPYVASLIAAVLWWRRLRVPFAENSSDPRAPVGRRFWRFTAPRSLASVAQLLMQRIDIVLVGALAGAVQAAIFTAATRFIVAGQMGRNAISLAVQPPLAEALAHRDRVAASRLFKTSAAWLIGASWPLYLTFCLPDSPLLSVFGHGYAKGSTILLLVSLGMLVGTGCGDVDSVLIMAGRTSLSLANIILGLAVMIGIDLWLIPTHGALGAAVGWGTAIAVKNIAALIQVWRNFSLHPFGRATLTMAALNLICFAAMPLGLRVLPVRGVLSLVLGLAVGTAAYLVGLWLLRRPLELDRIRRLPRRDAKHRQP